MELNIKFNEKMLVEIANGVLDEYKYNGKTIREWADLIANPKTNADRIRAMTDEELAEWVWSAESSGRAYGPRGKNAWLNWLKSPVQED